MDPLTSPHTVRAGSIPVGGIPNRIASLGVRLAAASWLPVGRRADPSTGHDPRRRLRARLLAVRVPERELSQIAIQVRNADVMVRPV